MVRVGQKLDAKRARILDGSAVQLQCYLLGPGCRGILPGAAGFGVSAVVITFVGRPP